MLKSAKSPEQNITKEERQAIKELKKVKEIIILPANMGKATVVLDKGEYEEKVTTMLDDKKTYEQLPDDPTPKYKRKLVATLGNLKKEGKITESKYKELYPTAENVPLLYCTPKIHKPNKPVETHSGLHGYYWIQYFEVAGGLVGNTQHHVKNSKQLADELAKVVLEDDEILYSYDVVSLFTNTPID